jgi:hypothetical protein
MFFHFLKIGVNKMSFTPKTAEEKTQNNKPKVCRTL